MNTSILETFSLNIKNKFCKSVILIVRLLSQGQFVELSKNMIHGWMIYFIVYFYFNPFHLSHVNRAVSIDRFEHSFCFSIYRYDIEGTTFSPPAHEDQFFYIRYPNSESKTDNQSGVKSLTEALKDLNTNPATASSTSSSSSSITITQSNFPKQHTDSCKKYLNSAEKGEFLFPTF